MNLPGPSASKTRWRTWATDRRLAMDDGAAFVANILDWLPGAPAGLVVTYLALGDEVDLADLVERSDRRFGLTRTPPRRGLLTVHPYDATREPHRFGFDQPVAGSEQIAVDDIGVVLVPGLVFDEDGGRIGRGAGYYDRFLVTLGDRPWLVGVVPENLVVVEVATASHDVAMTHLTTELGLRTMSDQT